MKSTIEELWYEYVQEREEWGKDREERRLNEELFACSEVLRGTMSDPQKQLLAQYDDALNAMYARESVLAFKSGVAFATNMIVEALQSK